MELGSVYKIMRARAPMGGPPVTTLGLSEPAAAPAPTISASGATEQQAELNHQESRPRRSLSAAVLTWGSALVEERSTAGVLPAAAAPEAPPPSSPVSLGPLHLVPRPLVPSARGVTIGPFAEALAAASSRPPRRRPGGGEPSSAMRLLIGVAGGSNGGGGGSGSPCSSPQPFLSLTSPGSPPVSPPLRGRASAAAAAAGGGGGGSTPLSPHPPAGPAPAPMTAAQATATSISPGRGGGAAAAVAAAAAAAGGGSKRARRGASHHPQQHSPQHVHPAQNQYQQQPQQQQPPQQQPSQPSQQAQQPSQQHQQQLMLPRVPSQKGGTVRQPHYGPVGSQPSQGINAATALSIMGLAPPPAPPAPPLSLQPAPPAAAAIDDGAAAGTAAASGSATSPEPSSSPSAVDPRAGRRTATGIISIAAGAPATPRNGSVVFPAMGPQAGQGSLPPTPRQGTSQSTWRPTSAEERQSRQGSGGAIGAPGLRPSAATEPGGGGAAAAAAGTTDACDGRHFEPSHGPPDAASGAAHSQQGGGSAAAMAAAAAAATAAASGGGGSPREPGSVQLPSLPLLASGTGYMGYQGNSGVGGTSRGRAALGQRQISSVSLASNGGGGGGHGSHRPAQQSQLLSGSGSWRQLMGPEDSSTGLLSGLLGNGYGNGVYGSTEYGDQEAEAAELDRLEQWMATAQLNPAVAEAAIEQRREMKRLQHLRSRLLRNRGPHSNCASPEPGSASGAGTASGAATVIPSWASDLAVTGRRGSDSLVALASQVSRLPHIDYDQMRDPQYRMKLKARSKQGRLAVLNPVINDEIEDMPIRGRRRPWKPLHI